MGWYQNSENATIASHDVHYEMFKIGILTGIRS